MPAFAYLRKSVVHQEDPHNSAEAQEGAVRAMAARHGDAESLVLLSDWDKSGKLGRAKRPGYDLLWQAIESGTATAIYSYSMSRLARSVSELTRLFETCQERGIPVRLEADVVDTSTASGRMTATILASVAAFEADVAGERLRAAYAAKSARGERVSTRTFYGEKAGEDAEAVLAAFHEAGSYIGAARLLNDRKVKPQTARLWWPTSVRVIVQRLEPSATRGPAQGSRAGWGTATFRLTRLLHCPIDGTTMTGRRDRKDRIRYVCQIHTAEHVRTLISESLILPAIRAEADRYQRPTERSFTLTAGDPVADERRQSLEAAHTLGALDDGAYRLALGKLSAVADEAEQDYSNAAQHLPVDWTAPAAQINRSLAALFSEIQLDPGSFEPVGFVWHQPGWRSA
jgi:DNA invertase Pin-like site-specific DNA recombinase